MLKYELLTINILLESRVVYSVSQVVSLSHGCLAGEACCLSAGCCSVWDADQKGIE